MYTYKDIENIFFLGIGGIGMSALARYFHRQGYRVSGYDRTVSELTRELEKEGIGVIYNDSVEEFERIAEAKRFAIKSSLVIRTPAVPEDSTVYTYLREQRYLICKRAEVLGEITRTKKALCVAGTHGKTTTSTMLAHLMKGVNAFLGGISMNYGSNLLVDKKSEYVVVEADEYDRSFYHLTPYMSVITAVDADHLDIYGTAEAYRAAFAHYTSLITGALVMKKGIALEPKLQSGVRCYTYMGEVVSQQPSDMPDFYASNIRIGEGEIRFDFHTPQNVISDIQLGVPVWVNVENAVAAMAVAWLNGVKAEDLRVGIASFKGVLRRFNIHVNTPKVVYIDDYAHHPQEMATAIGSVCKLFPRRRLIGVFQPHLYTRTRDFAEDFARVLKTLDEALVLPIYPAREEPIPGVTSEMLGGRVVEKKDIVKVLREKVQKVTEPVVVLTIGAGDIDRLVPEISKELQEIQ